MLTLAQATRIVDSALAKAANRGFHPPVCVVVHQLGAHAPALERDERASISRPEIATAQAAGCPGTGMGGAGFTYRLAANRSVPSGAMMRDHPT